MKRHGLLVVLMGFLVLLLSSCATYTYMGNTYHSPEAALEAQRVSNQKIQAEIKSAETRRGGSVAVIIPNLETCIAVGVKRTGSPPQELVDFVGKSYFESIRNMALSLETRGIFDRLTIVEDAFPIPASKKMKAEHDTVVYLDLAGPTQAQWFIAAAPEYKNLTVNFDNSKAEGYPRVKSWLDDIESRLDQVKYKPR